jgi:hypothetical protein
MGSCDVFISYSWSDDPAGPNGSSWARDFHAALERDLHEDAPVNVFLDQTSIGNGPVVDELRAQLESAKAFVAIVGDRWSHEDSWCRWELSHFRICASLHPQSPDARMARVGIGPFAEDVRLPGQLGNSPEYRFYSYTGREQRGRPYPLDVLRLPELEDYQRLIRNLKETLRGGDQRVSRTEAVAYVGDVPPTAEWQARRDRLCLDLRKKNIRPVSETRWPHADPFRLAEDIATRIGAAQASIHLLAPVEDGSQAATEFERALQITQRGDRTPLRLFLWSDSSEAPPPWASYVSRARQVRNVDDMIGKTWEYTLSNILNGIAARRPVRDDGEDNAALSGSRVFVQCLEEDEGLAEEIRQALEPKGHRVDYLPQPPGWIFRKPPLKGEDRVRREKYEELYQRSRGILVLHGNGKAHALWVIKNCDEIRAILQAGMASKVRGVCLVPPEQKKRIRHDDFRNYLFSRLDEFERDL